MQTLSKDNTEQIAWLDIAKGICIALVVLGHFLYDTLHTGGALHRAIYSFHMPMYFIAAGYVACPIISRYFPVLNGRMCKK